MSTPMIFQVLEHSPRSKYEAQVKVYKYKQFTESFGRSLTETICMQAIAPKATSRNKPKTDLRIY